MGCIEAVFTLDQIVVPFSASSDVDIEFRLLKAVACLTSSGRDPGIQPI